MNTWPVITPDQDRKVRERVAKRLADLSKENREFYLHGGMLGLERRSGAERLEFYRMQGQEYWLALASQNPEEFKYRMLDYASLAKRETR